MTTGRINQVSHLDLPGPARDPKGRGVPQGRQPPHEGGAEFGTQEVGVSEHPTGTAPRRTATTPTGHPIAPTESPRNRSAAEPGHPREGGRLGLRHTALGWRVPAADTPANGGSCGRPPPGNLTGNAGQRPTVHRLHPRRGHEGPRASAAIRAPGRPPRRGAGRGAPAGRSGSRFRRVTSRKGRRRLGRGGTGVRPGKV